MVAVNENIIEGKWEQLKGEVQKRWGKLTDDHLTKIRGDRRKLSGQIQEAYGIAENEAEKQIKDWEKTLAA
jgi:uncharacterized protein YjbJ (UPF0337 family)